MQARWGCPFAGGDGVTRDAECRATLGAVEALVGASPGEYRGCPCATLRTPDTELALTAYRWWKASQLTLRVGQPTAALVEAIDLIHNGLSMREADDIRRIRERDAPKTPTEP